MSPRSLPEEWLNGTKKSLKVAGDLGLKGSYPSNLVIYKEGHGFSNLQWRFLPDAAQDPRPFSGRSKNGQGRRLPFMGTTSTTEPFAAGKEAIQLANDAFNAALEDHAEQVVEKSHSLVVYWEKWYEDRAQEPRTNKTRWLRDKRNMWSGTNGIGQWGWAHNKSIEQITSVDIAQHFTSYDQHCADNGLQGGKQKEAYRTLLNNLFKRARVDFPGLPLPVYPKIQTQTKQERHLTHPEWERLISSVIELSEGAALKLLSPQEYKSLPFTVRNRKNVRNWVDLYDALYLQWFYYLRSQDMPIMRGEWFKEEYDDSEKDTQWALLLGKVKTNRDLHDTYTYRRDAYKNISRTLRRKPSGYLALPHLKRIVGSENESHVGETLNHLLKEACIRAGVSPVGVKWTTIRHTALRLTLEEYPELGTKRYIDNFAWNAHTSAPQLEDTYLKFIDAKETARKARAVIEPGKYSLVKRVSLE